ncbi:MAG: PASTA domain-containing protein [Phycisphaerales bacterium]|jgi:hypothetical protein
MSEENAGSRVKSAGFTISWTYQNSDTVAEGHVISQDPQGGTSAPEGSDVTLVLSVGSQYDPSVEPDVNCLLAHWKLDETEGSIAYDSAGINDGILMGNPRWSEGMLDGALDFDGDGDYVDCGTNEELNSLRQKMTVATWVNIRSLTTAWMAIAGKGETAWRLSVNNDTTGIHFGFTGGDKGWQGANSVTELPMEEWHHIAGVYDNEVGATIYIDGVAEANNPDLDGVVMNDMPFLLGENPESTGRFLDGLIDDVRIYGCALSVYEVLYLSSGQTESVDPGTEGLVAYYPLERDASDSSGNGRDGIAVGNPMFVYGMFNMAMEFDGDDYVDTGYTDDLATFTLSAWVISPAAPLGDPPSGPVHREQNYQINWNHHDSDWQGTVGIDAGGWHNASFGALEANTWYHLAGTYDGGELKAYKDGVLISTNDAPFGPPNSEWNSLKLARHAANAGQYFTGTIDEVRIYDRALSDDEIRYLARF